MGPLSWVCYDNLIRHIFSLTLAHPRQLDPGIRAFMGQKEATARYKAKPDKAKHIKEVDRRRAARRREKYVHPYFNIGYANQQPPRIRVAKLLEDHPLPSPDDSDDSDGAELTHQDARDNAGKQGFRFLYASQCSDPQDISFNIRRLRVEHTLWTMNWGPESLWENEFAHELASFKREGKVNNYFIRLERHTVSGRHLIAEIQGLGDLRTRTTDPDLIRDMFLQGFDLLAITLAEVKFFEVKLDEHAPTIPAKHISNIRTRRK
ncbi:hypothetical protein HWV62_15076 [Athelia sp. TMB]|nr:hypothetical protein HWV62_15076 [Athelia sp. TMB]